MIVNISKTERVIRVVGGLMVILLYYYGVIYGIYGLILLSFSGIAILSGLFGCCVFYRFIRHFIGKYNNNVKEK